MTHPEHRSPTSPPDSTALRDAQIRFQVDDNGRLYAFVSAHSSGRLALWLIAWLAGAIGGATAALIIFTALP